jgi:phosphomevalonate kinase
MKIVAKAPGKIILIGEYVVLEGCPALVCATNRFATVTIEETHDSHTITAQAIGIDAIPFSIENNLIKFASRVDEDIKERLAFFNTTLEYILELLFKNGLPVKFLQINIDTGSFYSEKHNTKFGFGSSAALTVSLLKAFYQLAGFDIKKSAVTDDLFRAALQTHKKAQQNIGSGIDIAASSYGKVLQYTSGYDSSDKHLIPEILDEWPGLPGLIVFSGKSESTGKMVFGVNQLKLQKPDKYKELMAQLDKTAREGLAAYKSKNLFVFMNAVKTYYAQMNLLGKSSKMPIVSDIHQKIARIVHRNAGAYKPSGAGSGDIGIAFAESPQQILKIRNELEEKGFECIEMKVANIL